MTAKKKPLKKRAVLPPIKRKPVSPNLLEQSIRQGIKISSAHARIAELNQRLTNIEYILRRCIVLNGVLPLPYIREIVEGWPKSLDGIPELTDAVKRSGP
jgi:hypothetical protein